VPQSLARVYVQIVFSTKNRNPWIDEEIESQLHAYMAEVMRACGCPVMAINGTEDHVHILCTLARVITMADLVEEVKKRSSKWIKTRDERYESFAWQNGYGAFSVGERGLETVIAYIEKQKEHHRNKTFRDEYREFLDFHRIDYDERYVWD